MTYHDYLIEALETVSAWDLPEEDLAEAANQQARLMAGDPPESIWDHSSEFTSL